MEFKTIEIVLECFTAEQTGEFTADYKSLFTFLVSILLILTLADCIECFISKQSMQIHAYLKPYVQIKNLRAQSEDILKYSSLTKGKFYKQRLEFPIFSEVYKSWIMMCTLTH